MSKHDEDQLLFRHYVAAMIVAGFLLVAAMILLPA